MSDGPPLKGRAVLPLQLLGCLKLGRMILHLDNRQELTAAYKVLHNDGKCGRPLMKGICGWHFHSVQEASVRTERK